jgi:ATP-dependent DNA helicase RecQ
VTHALTREYSATELSQSLNEVFGFSQFRALQEQAVAAAARGDDLLVVMPTGAGKSLCYQLPAAIAEGTTLVVSPLVALMRDQVVALQERTAFAELGAAFLNSSQTAEEQRAVLQLLRVGQLKILYVAPERFRAPSFVDALKSIRLARFVVDEAHCISQWGHDFRPDYLTLKSAVEALGHPPLTAVTATATTRVQDSIIENLGMRNPQVFIGGFDRPNLHFSVVKCESDRDRAAKLMKALPKLAKRGGSGLIYVATRKQCEEVASLAAKVLAPLKIKSAPYHAGMEPEARNAIQSGWLDGEIHLLIATNAFGMGVDKPDVRYVIHWAYPESPEAYYQEAGRAGRDGRKSRVVILYHFADKRLREFFIDNDAISSEMISGALAAIGTRLQTAPPRDEFNNENFNAPGFNGESFNGESFNGTPESTDENIASIPKSWWRQALGWNEILARSVLGKLEHFGLIERISENPDTSVLRVLQRQIAPDLQRTIERHLQNERGERHARLNEMIAFCKSSQCRRRTLLEYFGDEHEATPREYCCDVCDAPEKFQQAEKAMMPAALDAGSTPLPSGGAGEGANIHTILQNMDALRPRVGKAKLEKLLRGAKSKDLEKFAADHPLLGVLRGSTRDQVVKFLNDLLDENLLAQAGEEEYFVCYVTEDGRRAWQEQQEISVALPGRFTASQISQTLDNDEPGAELFEELRSWRRRRADEEHVPPYCVFGDKTLRAIAALRPLDEESLSQISGVGHKKIEKYGDDVLAIVQAT